MPVVIGKVPLLKPDADSLTYLKRRYRFWASRPIEGTPKTGSFTQDARGRWYINIQCEVDDPGSPTGTAEIGIDLGLTNQVQCSDREEPYSRANLRRKHEEALAMAQRAHKKKRVKAIHAKIKHCRQDWTHKTTTEIVARAALVAVGNVSSPQLAKTSMAKSVYDAGWGQLRTRLEYKAKRLGVLYREVFEYGSTVTCSVCGARTGPSGLGDLGVRVWVCAECGTRHQRDQNAAHIHLRRGRATLPGIP
jgi:IS605 OrfB family transposase